VNSAQHQPAQPGRFDGTVAVWFTPHHAFVTRDWDNIRAFDGAYHPLLGEYKSDDPPVLQAQLRWMRRAGKDLIVYDAYLSQGGTTGSTATRSSRPSSTSNSTSTSRQRRSAEGRKRSTTAIMTSLAAEMHSVV
jgi:hypothetical protein